MVRQIKEASERSEEILHKCRESRKQYLTEYFLAALLFLVLLVFGVKGIYIPRKLTYFVLFFIAVLILVPEYRRIVGFQYLITKSKITSIKGLIKQKRKNIHFFALGFVPDINLKQTRIQRFLNYGTIYIEGGESDTVSIRDVDQPSKVMSLVEDLINKKREAREQAES